jgi:hypothetical protein
MSSYSEYLGRMKQRMVTITDTRPHRDAGHQTEIVRRLAASGNLETAVANTACLLPLNAPSTRSSSGYNHGGGHKVQSMSTYVAYRAGQAVAQAERRSNAKASQITNTMPCLSSSQLPEINDKIAADPTGFGAIYNARQLGDKGYNTCLTCGAIRKSQLASACNCRLTVAQAAGLKSTIQWPHTADPSA